MDDGAVVINVDLNTKGFDAQIEELEDKLDTLTQEYEAALKDKDFPEDELVKYRSEIEKTTNKIVNLRKKQDELNRPPTNLRDFFADMSNNLSANIKKVKRLVLGIFGIRGAYMAIRNAMNIITQDDEQMKADIDYIKAVLAYSLEPIVRGIVDLVKTIVAYIGYIAQAWFGVNIFEKAHNKMLKQGVGYAKELRKQLAGFDEMNVLQSDTSGGGTSGAMPDFSSFENPEIPYWIDWIAHNKDIVLGFLGGIAGIIAGMKIADFASHVLDIFGVLKGIPKLKAIGIIGGLAITIDGIYNTIKNVLKYIDNPSWNNFNGILSGISETLGGIGITMLAFNITNPAGWLAIATAYVVDHIKQTSTLFQILVDGKANIKDLKDAQEDLNNAILNAKTAEEQYYKALDNKLQAQQKLKELEEQLQTTGTQLHEEVKNGTKKYEELTPELKNLFWAYLDLDKAEETVKATSEKLEKAQDDVKNKTIDTALSAANTDGDWDKFAEAIEEASKDSSYDIDYLKNEVERAMSKMDTKTRKTFMENLPSDIKEGLNPDKYSADAWNLVDVINNILSYINPQLGGFFQNIRWATGQIFGHAKGGIVVPRLARGGVINNPGRGVPLASAVGGERGAEGVIPLTDSQQMALLGEAIGRYVTINANIVNQMNGRVLSRELQRVQNNSDFAYNR